MKYSELLKAIGVKTGLGVKTVDKVLDALRDTIEVQPVGERTTLPKFGTFERKVRAPKRVKTLAGPIVEVEAREAVTFRASRA